MHRGFNLEVQRSEMAPPPMAVINCRTARGSQRMLRSNGDRERIRQTTAWLFQCYEPICTNVDRGIRWLPRAVLQLNGLALS